MANGNSGVPSVYLHVIDDVVNKVRDEFISSGAGESVLSELQAMWEMKLVQCGVLPPNIQRPAPPKLTGTPTPVHDLNVPYEGHEEYETPTAEMLFPPTPLQTPIQTPLPGTGEHHLYQTPTPGEYAPVGDPRDISELKGGRPSHYMNPPSPWLGNQRPLGVDVNVAYVEGREEVDRGGSHQSLTQDFLMASSGKRKRDSFTPHHPPAEGVIPQQDGSGDTILEFILPETTSFPHSSKEHKEESVITQIDGNNDDSNNSYRLQGGSSEIYNSPVEPAELRAPTPAVGTPRLAKIEVLDDDEPPLNEDDDDDEDLDDLRQGEEETQTHHLVLAQFDRVSRTKSRWKCTLKDGIMHINNRDVLFNKANGEFEF
ncbi:Transcription factor IIA [Zostera marina]|uniref:Transcription factor IIA n=1 Tax=Zostera marina TaxID=29655 RepID=A0A0K9Q385_ZOSMR|nr:Transcription factor IIA [Zostera marina]